MKIVLSIFSAEKTIKVFSCISKYHLDKYSNIYLYTTMTNYKSGLIGKLGTMLLAGATGLVGLAGCEAPRGNRNTSPYTQSQPYQQQTQEDGKFGQAILGGILGAGLGTVGLPANMNPIARAATEATTRGIGNGMLADASRAQTKVIVNGENGNSIYEKEGYIIERLSKGDPEKREQITNRLSKLSPEKRKRVILGMYGYYEAKNKMKQDSETEAGVVDEKKLPEYNFEQLRREVNEQKAFPKNTDKGIYSPENVYGGIFSVITSNNVRDLNGDSNYSFDEITGKKRNFKKGEPITLNAFIKGPRSVFMLYDPTLPSDYEITCELFNENGELMAKKSESGRIKKPNEVWINTRKIELPGPGVYTAKLIYKLKNDSKDNQGSERCAVFQVLD